jgi:hypothetical protein
MKHIRALILKRTGSITALTGMVILTSGTDILIPTVMLWMFYRIQLWDCGRLADLSGDLQRDPDSLTDLWTCKLVDLRTFFSPCGKNNMGFSDNFQYFYS